MYPIRVFFKITEQLSRLAVHRSMPWDEIVKVYKGTHNHRRTMVQDISEALVVNGVPKDQRSHISEDDGL